MRRSLLVLTCALFVTVAAAQCSAGIITFTVGAPSFVSIGIDNGQAFQQSPVTGTGTLELPTASGTGQITTLELTLTNGLSFSVPALGATASTAPGDVSFSLVTPGAAATLIPGNGGSNFDQLGNQLAADGDLTFSNSSTLDFDTVIFPSVDFEVGFGPAPAGGPNDFSLGGLFLIEHELDVDGTTIPFVVVGNFIGPGTKAAKAVPEPGSTMILIGMGTVLLIRRRR